MRGQQLRRIIEQKGVAIGAFFDLSEPLLVEMAGHLGFDYVILEWEHGLRDPRTLQELLRAADVVGLPAIVRLGDANDNLLGQMLDEGASGFMPSHVATPEKASAIVRASRYPPDGIRGAGFCRAEAFGDHWEKYRRLNREVLVIPLIEDPEGVEQIEGILDVEGVDGVCPGPGDLCLSMGLTRRGPGQRDSDPTVLSMVQKVVEATRRRGKLLMAFSGDPEEAESLVRGGTNMIAFGHDARLIADLYRRSLDTMRKGVEASLKTLS